MKIDVGDIIELKKNHPCGGKTWKVLRIGADFKLACETCGAHVMIPRVKVEKRIKKIIYKNEGE